MNKPSFETTINGEKRLLKISWDECSYGDYLGIIKPGTDRIKVLAWQLGIDYEKLKKSRIQGLERVLSLLAFIEVAPIINQNPKKLGEVVMPKDATMETLEQYQHCEELIRACNVQDTNELSKLYPKLVAVYYQAARDKDFDFEKATAAESEILSFPCEEVLSFGHFFYLKSLSIQTNIPLSSLKALTRLRKRRPAFLRWTEYLDSMVFWIRLRGMLLRMTR